MNAIKYLDAIKKRHLMSDYKIAQELGVSRQRISDFRTGKVETMSDEMCLKVANLLDMEPLTVIADMNTIRAKDRSTRLFWKSLGSAAVLIFSLTLGTQYVDSGGIIMPLDIERAIHYAQSWGQKTGVFAVFGFSVIWLFLDFWLCSERRKTAVIWV